MVDISSQNNKINITVSSSGNTANTNITPDYAQYYSEKSKEWAISNRIVDNTDYSSKYYAKESKKQADISTAKATEVVESGNTAVSNIESARDNAITDITNQESLSVDNVNTAGVTQVSSVNTAGITQVANVNSAGTTQINLAKEQVTLATNQANIATEQATIATNKTSEVVASGNEALSNIDTAKNNAITSITNQETTSKTVLIDEGATQVGLIQNEGATQVANVQSTGFYMKDDKLYYINSQGEETEFKLDDIELNNPYSLFDSKYSDHELNNLSWLKSEGQWNSKAVYPTAYDKLLKVYNGTETVEGLSVKLSTETYTDYDFVLNTSDETFRLPLLNGSEDLPSDTRIDFTEFPYTAPKNGLVYIYFSGANSNNRIFVNGNEFVYNQKAASYFGCAFTVPVCRGDVVTYEGPLGGDNRLYPYKSNGSLYFYVGETVQNANLIDAGRIGEQLANKQDKLSRYPIEISDKSLMPSWYVVYNDGWCEQGGYSTSSNVTIQLLKIYANTNYTITLGKAFNNETNSRFPNIVSTAKTTAQFKVTGAYNNTTGTDCYFYWETKGYMA